MTNPLSDDLSDPGYSDIIANYLTQWGLQDLIPTLTSLGQTGASNDQINLTLQQTDTWKQRFAGNQTRVANGLAALDPASYIALEGSYKQVLNSYGIPAGFYDDKATTDQWIGGDVSASEINDRAKMASDAYLNAPQSAKDAWDQFYGNTSGAGGAIAAILDTKTAEPVIQQQVAAAAIGGAAINQGLTANVNTATTAVQQGVTIDSARAAYQQIASRLAPDTAIASRFGAAPGTFGQTQEENATLLNQADAQRQLGTMYSEEAAQFEGHGGASDASGNSGSNY